MSKNHKIAFVTYLLVLALVVFGIRNVLAVKGSDFGDAKEEKKAVKTHEVSAVIQIRDGGTNLTYQTKVLNTDSVYDALDNLREDKVLSFEMTTYVDHVTIDSVNNVSSTPEKPWRIYLNETEITDKFRDLNIELDYVVLIAR